MNIVILKGRLTKDVEVRSTGSGLAVASFAVAVDRRFKDANGNKQTDFINCVAWRQQASFLGQYFHKGSPILITGELQTRSFEDNGQKRFVSEVIVDSIEFCESAGAANQQAPTAPQIPDVVIPDQASSSVELPFEV